MHAPLPRLLLIADGVSDTSIADTVEELAAAELVPWVQFRDHEADRIRFRTSVRRIVHQTRRLSAATTISINTDVALANEIGAGLHVGFRGPSPQYARRLLGEEALIGFSAHSVDELTGPLASVVDYFTVSPVFDSISKPAVKGAGIGFLRECARVCERPVLALGGVKPENVSSCLEVGAHGVAVLGGILAVRDPTVAAAQYLEEVETFNVQPPTLVHRSPDSDSSERGGDGSNFVRSTE